MGGVAVMIEQGTHKSQPDELPLRAGAIGAGGAVDKQRTTAASLPVGPRKRNGRLASLALAARALGRADEGGGNPMNVLSSAEVKAVVDEVVDAVILKIKRSMLDVDNRIEKHCEKLTMRVAKLEETHRRRSVTKGQKTYRNKDIEERLSRKCGLVQKQMREVNATFEAAAQGKLEVLRWEAGLVVEQLKRRVDQCGALAEWNAYRAGFSDLVERVQKLEKAGFAGARGAGVRKG
jgi:hypothetical protein